MITPENCASLAQVRAEIDQLDEQVVRVLARRGGYVPAAAAMIVAGALHRMTRAPNSWRRAHVDP
jgi:hypothetical protein